LCGQIEINRLIGLSSKWLQRHIGKPSREIPVTRDGNFIDCGRREGYFNSRIQELCLLAQEGKKAGSTMMSWGHLKLDGE
jgi:hypothetical protein